MQTTKDNEFELQVVEVRNLPKRSMMRPAGLIAPQRPSAPTRAEALARIQAAKNADSVFARIPMLRRPEQWVETGYWSVSQKAGPAATGICIFDCDFPDGYYEGFAADNRVFFAGAAEKFGDAISPTDLTGLIWCEMNAPATGWYCFSAQLGTAIEGVFPNDPSTVEVMIDETKLGTLSLTGDEIGYPFVAYLEEGSSHLFAIQQKTGAFYFWSLTAWQIRNLSLPGGLEPQIRS